jgi:hypothetical protein
MGSDGITVLSDPAFRGDAYRYANAGESLELGILGSYAGSPGKKYPAQRVFVESTKTFRIPMARRQDVSQIQPGYRLEIAVGGANAQVSQVLCDYSARSSPQAPPQPLFPSTVPPIELRTDQATVYTVVQNGLFTAGDEDSWEKHGEVVVARPKKSQKNGLLQGVELIERLLPGKKRILLEPRQGKAALTVKIEFSLDLSNPEQSFVGHATVSVTNPGTGDSPRRGHRPRAGLRDSGLSSHELTAGTTGGFHDAAHRPELPARRRRVLRRPRERVQDPRRDRGRARQGVQHLRNPRPDRSHVAGALGSRISHCELGGVRGSCPARARTHAATDVATNGTRCQR